MTNWCSVERLLTGKGWEEKALASTMPDGCLGKGMSEETKINDISPRSERWCFWWFSRRLLHNWLYLLGKIHFYRILELEVDDQEHVCGLLISSHSMKKNYKVKRGLHISFTEWKILCLSFKLFHICFGGINHIPYWRRGFKFTVNYMCLGVIGREVWWLHCRTLLIC